jgi:hypothetical protein
VAQNQLDQRFDEAVIEGFNTSYGVAICRVVTGHVLQLLALLVFFGGLHDEDSPVLHRPHTPVRTWDDTQSLHMYCTFVVIGTGCAIVYGTYAQTVSMFPQRYHAFFFIGTYSVSWAIAPFNILIGALCPLAVQSTESAGGEHGTCVVGDACPQWTKIGVFYTIGAMFNIMGLLAFIALTSTQLGQQVYALKDEVLVPTSSGRRRNNTGNASSPAAPQQLGGGGASSIQVGDLVVVNPPESSFSTGRTATDSDADARSIYSGSSSDSNGADPDGTSGNVWSVTLGCGLVMMLALCENLLICGQYSSLKSQGQIPSLGTVMMYSFYASQCVGASMLTSERVQHLLNSQRTLLVLAILRLPGVPMIFYHNRHPSGLFGNDVSLLLFYSVHMWLGGLVFCQSFTVATHLFDNPADKTVGATVMNVLYYVGVCVTSIFLLFV